jgi:hypothetical protein
MHFFWQQQHHHYYIMIILNAQPTYHNCFMFPSLHVLVVHTLRVAENEISKLDLPAMILCLLLVSLEFLVAAPEPFLCINNVAVCP